MHKEEIEINSKKVAYYHKGCSKNQVIMVHGNSQSSKIWQKQFESELLNTCELFAIDLPGHGDSFRSHSPELDYSCSAMCNVVAEFIKKIATEKPILVGHSLGGHLLLELVPKIGQPGGLVIFGTPPLKSTADTADAFIKNELFELIYKRELSNTEIEKLAKNLFYSNVPEFVKSDIKNTDKGLRETVLNFTLQDEYKILKSFGKKAAIFHGRYDRNININYILKLKINSIWNSKVHIIENAAHCPQFENPEVFNQLLLSFIKSLNQ